MNLCAGKLTKKFIILFEGRTGSSHVRQLLNGHPDIVCDSEQLYGLNAASQKVKIAEMLSVNIPFAGFKTKLRDVKDPDYFARLIERENIRIIYLDRKNLVKTVVSTLYAQMLVKKTGDYNRRKQNMQEYGPIHIQYSEFEWHIKLRKELDEKLLTFFEKLSVTKTHVYYEEMLVDEEGFMRRLIEFLGAEWQPLNSSILIKAVSDDLRNSVANFDELRSRYIGTPYEAMFDEILNQR
ncbi:MAG: hypothetical protein JXD22_16990 [Sedimentisphaerales bacterium]|nr:hypothetical protein [Sedimentisphaerales bacterium]